MNLNFILLTLLFWLTEETLGPGDKKSKNKQVKNDKSIEISEDTKLSNQNLVTKELKNVDEIVHNHFKYKNNTQKSFPNTILGYVTPWNSHGYDICKIFSSKLTYVSPVWLQVKRIKRKTYEFSGTHDIDELWMSQVASEFMPRILFEKWTPQDLHSLFNDEQEMQSLIKMLIKNSNKYKFSGYVLEIYIELNGYSKPEINHLISDLAEALHKIHKKLFIVIPPAIGSDGKSSNKHIIFSREDFDSLKTVVDGFSLMTYDYASHSGKVGANAPIKWIQKNIEYLSDNDQYRPKILMGLNFYGMKYPLNTNSIQPEPIIGSSLVDLFKRSKVEIKYDSTSEEHSFYATGENGHLLVFYPTLYSIYRRVELAKEHNVGLSIWELGQGLDYFYDLF